MIAGPRPAASLPSGPASAFRPPISGPDGKPAARLGGELGPTRLRGLANLLHSFIGACATPLKRCLAAGSSGREPKPADDRGTASGPRKRLHLDIPARSMVLPPLLLSPARPKWIATEQCP